MDTKVRTRSDTIEPRLEAPRDAVRQSDAPDGAPGQRRALKDGLVVLGMAARWQRSQQLVEGCSQAQFVSRRREKGRQAGVVDALQSHSLSAF